jgi:PilZ domain-containing protein
MSVPRESPHVERRQARRIPAGWVGQYMIPSRPDLGWRDCLVVDVSATGLGLLLFGRWPENLRAELDILVCLEPHADTDSVEMTGTIRNSTPINGELRVGIELNGWDQAEPVTVRGVFAPA